VEDSFLLYYKVIQEVLEQKLERVVVNTVIYPLCLLVYLLGSSSRKSKNPPVLLLATSLYHQVGVVVKTLIPRRASFRPLDLISEVQPHL